MWKPVTKKADVSTRLDGGGQAPIEGLRVRVLMGARYVEGALAGWSSGKCKVDLETGGRIEQAPGALGADDVRLLKIAYPGREKFFRYSMPVIEFWEEPKPSKMPAVR